MPAPESRAQHIAARLSSAQCTPRVIHRRNHIRVEAELPDELSDAEWLVVLDALADGDRFGHSHNEDGDTVWAAISTAGPDGAGRSTRAHRRTDERQQPSAADTAEGGLQP